LRITFLGTGTSQGIPMIGCRCDVCLSTDSRDKRLRPSVFITLDDGTSILIDTSADFRAQALTHDITHIDAVLFTHSHADHVFGLDELRRYNVLQRDAIPLYGDERTLADLRRIFDYAFRQSEGGHEYVPRLRPFLVDGPFCVRGSAANGARPSGVRDSSARDNSARDNSAHASGAHASGASVSIVPVPILHGARMILGYRLGNFAYLTDCSGIPDASFALLDGVELLVIGALRDRPHPSHFTVAEAIEAASKIGASRVYFTHMNHDLGHVATCARLPAGIQLAYDGLVVQTTA
jgi:phosphoribosyl 1,2-cyclic phosphate phosphodiesterase